MVNFRFGRVYVFGQFFVFRAEHTSTECYNFTRKCMYRKHDTSPKAVAQTAVVCFVTKPGFNEIFLFESFTDSLLCQCIVAFRTETQLEFFNNIVPETPLTEISHTDTSTVYVIL